ncbi:MAG: hypothetical protein K6F32_00445 [Bacilli bacterium]|nr:hypothetical protein [Bacilli bacterium]
MKRHNFYGADAAKALPIDPQFRKIGDPCRLYDILSDLWCAETCAPRMREDWSKENKTLGQCSITAFLVQDIYGGEVYGVPLDDGAFHCFNVVGEAEFDLTSEQFGDKKLTYARDYPQSRLIHFAKAEKKMRYEALKAALLEAIGK